MPPPPRPAPRPQPARPRLEEEAPATENDALQAALADVPTQVKGVGLDDEPPAVEAPRPDAGVTVMEGPERPRISSPPALSAPPAEAEFAARYRAGEVLGLGGMGEVRLSTDLRIGRVVAMKSIRPEGQKRQRLIDRFLLEAKMQGQLEHPSIVPVYDLGVRPDGSLYFTMRRVRGQTLFEVLRLLRTGDKAATASFTRRRLVAALQSVSLAAEFAHQRGVVHRDLKPANIMLGEFGEVIVLDWGLGKVHKRDPLLGLSEGEVALSHFSYSSVDRTAVGEVLGSPGYMAPEQAVDSKSVGPRADIFALGAMLFEVLTLEHLVTGKDSGAIAKATIAGEYEPRISRRFPELDVAPELEEICVKATDHNPAARYESAREIADAIERYLEGDRDVARRRLLAGKHTRAAIAALSESVEAQSPEGQKAARGRAIREVNNALAIDPQNQTALRTMMKIITEAPNAVVPEVDAAYREGSARALQVAARRGALAYLAVTANIGLMGLLGVVHPGWLGASCGCFLLAALLAFVGGRRQSPFPAETVTALVIAVSSLGIAFSGMLFGALVYAPSLCAANVVVFAAGVEPRFRYLSMVLGVLALAAPIVLEALGVVPASWVFTEAGITILPRVIRFPGVPTMALLGAASVGTVLFPALLVGAERDARAKAERELLVRSHTLAEFVPAEAKATAVGEAGRRSLLPGS